MLIMLFLAQMSVVSLPLPSYRHYLTAWLEWIEYTLPGCLQGSVLSPCVIEVVFSNVRIHDQRYLYADDTVYERPAAACQNASSSSLQQLPATIVGGFNNC